MPIPILARADALMHRQRPSHAESDDIPLLVDAIDQNGEIPVLLDAEPEPAPTSSPSKHEVAVAASATPVLKSEMLDSLAQELARRVHARLATELPRIVEETVRDLLAEPEMRALLRPRN